MTPQPTAGTVQNALPVCSAVPLLRLCITIADPPALRDTPDMIDGPAGSANRRRVTGLLDA
ncbi:hypothetical protein [Burkholderia sp. LMG 21824]|uniref:hypothetical protein n=1 Tax=Burkholderia sp. LMG 21824 TaxID=3158172 RepID=UPI003C2AF212